MFLVLTHELKEFLDVKLWKCIYNNTRGSVRDVGLFGLKKVMHSENEIWHHLYRTSIVLILHLMSTAACPDGHSSDFLKKRISSCCPRVAANYIFVFTVRFSIPVIFVTVDCLRALSPAC